MATPKYQRIEERLITLIKNGTFQHGDRIYSEAELAAMFHASSTTVVRALRDLVARGYLVREQGKGTFVSRSRTRQLVALDDVETSEERAAPETTEVLSKTRGHEPDVLCLLALDDAATYWRIERVRLKAGVPSMYSCSYLPEQLVRADVPPAAFTSLYRRLSEDFGIELADAPYTEENEVVFPTPPAVARLLEVDEQTPCVLQRRRSALADGRIAEYVVTYKRWDRWHIRFTANGGVEAAGVDGSTPAASVNS